MEKSFYGLYMLLDNLYPNYMCFAAFCLRKVFGLSDCLFLNRTLPPDADYARR